MRSIYTENYGNTLRYFSKILAKELKGENGEECTIGILQYNSFDESFYYADSIKDALRNPDDVSELHARSIWSYELIYLVGKSLLFLDFDITKIFDRNDELVNKEASLYGILVENYKIIKNNWEGFYKTDLKDIILNYEKRELSIEEVPKNASKIFHFSCFVLSILGFDADSSFQLSYAQRVFKFIRYRNPSNISTKIAESLSLFNRGELNPGNIIAWRMKNKGTFAYWELANILELFLKQPLKSEKKEIILKRYISIKLEHSAIGSFDWNYESKQSSNITALCLPLIQNIDFLGIIYIIRETENANAFNKDDLEKLKDIISKLNLTNLLYELKQSAAIKLIRLDYAKSGIQQREHVIRKLVGYNHFISSSSICIGFQNVTNDNIYKTYIRLNTFQYKPIAPREDIVERPIQLLTFFLNLIPKDQSEQPFGIIEIPEEIDFGTKFKTFIRSNTHEYYTNVIKENRVNRIVFQKINIDNEKHYLFFLHSNFLVKEDVFHIGALKQRLNIIKIIDLDAKLFEDFKNRDREYFQQLATFNHFYKNIFDKIGSNLKTNKPAIDYKNFQESINKNIDKLKLYHEENIERAVSLLENYKAKAIKWAKYFKNSDLDEMTKSCQKHEVVEVLKKIYDELVIDKKNKNSNLYNIDSVIFTDTSSPDFRVLLNMEGLTIIMEELKENILKLYKKNDKIVDRKIMISLEHPENYSNNFITIKIESTDTYYTQDLLDSIGLKPMNSLTESSGIGLYNINTMLQRLNATGRTILNGYKFFSHPEKVDGNFYISFTFLINV